MSLAQWWGHSVRRQSFPQAVFGAPWRLRGVIGWGQVASVMSPTNGLPGVRLQLTSGKVVVLADICSEQTDVVASIGNKAV